MKKVAYNTTSMKRVKKSIKKEPLVSIIIPVYNAERYIEQSLQSIVAQTYRNIEIILVNDASTDKSDIILAKYKKKYPKKITIISLKENLNAGGDKCANLGILEAQGDYIARMDADDIAAPTRIEKQVAFLESNPDIFLVGSNAYVIDKEGTVIGEKKEPSHHSEIYASYFTFHPIIHPTCMFRKNLKNKAFSYAIKYSANNDYYTFSNLICNGYKFANLPEKLLYYRIHGKNDTFVHMKKKYFNTLKIRIEMVKNFGYKPGIKKLTVAAIQTIIVFSLPETILTRLYFLAKGITKFQLPHVKPVIIKAQRRFMNA